LFYTLSGKGYASRWSRFRAADVTAPKLTTQHGQNFEIMHNDQSYSLDFQQDEES
jgi:hypothetical protein